MDSCIFCKIVKQEIPCYKVYEDKQFLAFLDIHPLNKGHTLIIPKKHYRWVWDEEDQLIAKHMQVSKKIALALQKAFGIEWIVFDIAGIGVAHAHIHLIPRFPNDGHGEFVAPKNVKIISPEEMREIAKKIATFL